MTSLKGTLPEDMGALLFKGTVSASNNMEAALEAYCYKNKLHVQENHASLLYMILGYLSTFPHTEQFRQLRMNSMFLRKQSGTIKILVQYDLDDGYERKHYRAFLIHTDPTVPKKPFRSTDMTELVKFLKEESPDFNEKEFRDRVLSIRQVSIMRPPPATVYHIFTDGGVKAYLAHEGSPFKVKVKYSSLKIKRVTYTYKLPYAILKKPSELLGARDVIEQINVIFQQVVSALKLESSPKNLFHFLQGALEFNYKVKENLRIRPYFDLLDSSFNKLFVQKRGKERWKNSEAPIVVIAGWPNGPVNIIDGVLPSDFDCSAEATAQLVKFSFLDNGDIFIGHSQFPIAARQSIVEQLLGILESGAPITRQKDLGPVIDRMELDTEFFFAKGSRPQEHFLNEYILGQLMAYSGALPIETFSHEYYERGDSYVTFVIKREGGTDGVAIHILEDPAVDQEAINDVIETPDYRAVGLSGRILNLYLDCRVIDPSQLGLTISKLSRLPLRTIFLHYSQVSFPFLSRGTFRKIDQNVMRGDLYLSLVLENHFPSFLVDQAVKLNLVPKTNFEFETLIKSFLLAKNDRATFIPYPETDPTIVGVNSVVNLPVVLIKSGVDTAHDRLLIDLRATYMGDQKYEQKKEVIFKAISLNTVDMKTFMMEEYTNGNHGPLYEMCIDQSRFKRHNGDFCHSKRAEQEKIEEENEIPKLMIPEEKSYQRSGIFNKNIEQHLQKVGTFSSALMHGTVAKNILGALIDEDFKEVAINIGFLTGSIGLSYVASYATYRGSNLMAQGNKVLGSSLTLASPFLARASSAFVAYDLYKQIRAYKTGDKDSLVSVVSDSFAVTIDVASAVIESLEATELLGSSLSAFGPIGAAVGAVIFIGTDIYQAVRTVDKINSVLHLSPRERFKEGILAFIHARPDKYLVSLLEAKELNIVQAKLSMEILRNLPEFQIYGSPSLVRCTMDKSNDTCTNGFKEIEDNSADFTRLSRFHTRTWPQIPGNFRSICVNEKSYKLDNYYKSNNDVEFWLSRGEPFLEDDIVAPECHNFEAIFNASPGDGKKAFFRVGSGNDRIIGFESRSNVISFTDGNKYLVGGKKPDTFLLHGENITTGFIDGGDGADTLDFSNYSKTGLPITFYNGYETAHFLVVNGSNLRLDINNIENFIGRPDAPDIMITNCNTKFINLQGGTFQYPDAITIDSAENSSCNYHMIVEMYPNTDIWNQACNGKFHFILNNDQKSGTIRLRNYCQYNRTADIVVKINSSLNTVMQIRRTFEHGEAQLKIEFQNKIVLIIIDLNPEQVLLFFDDFNVRVESIGIVGYKKVPVIENIHDTIAVLSDLYNLNMILIVEDESNHTKIITGHDQMSINANNLKRKHNHTGANVFVYDPRFEQSIFVSGKSVGNIFDLMTECTSTVESHGISCRTIVAHIYLEENKTSTFKNEINLSDAYKTITSANRTIEITPLIHNNTMFLHLWIKDVQSTRHFLGMIVIHNIDKERLDTQVTLILNVAFYFQIESEDVIMKPVPLIFSSVTKLIILQADDVAEHMPVKILKSIGDFLSVLKSNDTHVILTNMMDPYLKKNPSDIITLCLVNYYESKKYVSLFNSLSLKFKDRTINIGDLLYERRNDMLDFEMFKAVVLKLNTM